MALEETSKKLVGTLASTFRFLSAYGRRIFLLTFRPRMFATQFRSGDLKAERLSDSRLFLVTTVLLLAFLLEVATRATDAASSISDVGLLAVLQSGDLWSVSWEELTKRTLPLIVAMYAIN
jgi:hypothetical protein